MDQDSPRPQGRAADTAGSARAGSVTAPTLISAVHELPLAQLQPWPENPRSIRPERLDDLKQALRADPEMLTPRPLLALPDGTVFCGNQRLRAARELGWQSIPVITVDLDPQRARLWALRDNNPYGDWDEPQLAELLAELSADGVELALSGFAGRDLDQILAGISPRGDLDQLPDLAPERPDSRPGEIYHLGPHRLACGDARDPDLLARLLGSEQPVLVWTHPPYGLSYSGKTRAALTIKNDDSNAALLLEQVPRRIDPHQVVLDPFAGSGSTLIACAQLGRHCRAVELDPGYCDVIRRRFEEASRDA